MMMAQKSIKYYNAETCKVLTSWNIHFLSLTNDSPPEPIGIIPNALHKGETEGSMLLTSGNNGDSLKRKWDKEEELNQRQTQGKHMDYQYLDNPFSDEDDDETTYTLDEQLFAIVAGDEHTSLKDAQNSPDWPEWEKVIQSKLAQLNQMGTWRLVKKPPNAILIANKWTFVKKRNKAGEVVKFKARLIKTLYGLKQSGCEWNIEFDRKMKGFGFKWRCSDPCIYIKWDGNEVVIVTV